MLFLWFLEGVVWRVVHEDAALVAVGGVDYRLVAVLDGDGGGVVRRDFCLEGERGLSVFSLRV
jgi:hypothetical protein